MAADLQKIKTTRRLRILFKSALTRRINKNTHMNTRLRLTALAAVFAFLTPPTFTLHARVLGPEAIEVPDGTRKCIKPKDRAPKPTDLLFAPLTCLEPVVNVSATAGNQAESFVNVNPTNTNNLVAISNTNANSIFRAYSFDGGTTWTRGTIATNVACCDGQAAWDTFGNLFVVYINNSVNQINVILSTDGGVTFSAPLTVGTGSIDQPSIAVGNGSVWVDWNQSGSMVARGAPVTGLGVWGPFNAQQAIPSATGSFGGIAVGPGPNGGKVIVTYQNPTGGQGPATIYANVDADGLGAGGFGPRITVSATNVGGFDYIPAQNERSIDAEAGLVWDATGGPFNNRIYLVYTDETVNENNDTEIYVRTSTDDGGTWTAPVRVNDDPLGPIRSQFLPYIVLDRTTGTVAVGFHDCRNDNGVPGPGGTNNIPNDDAEYYGTFSTDGGLTWAPNTRLSGGFSNATDSGNGVDYGDYVGLDAHAGKLYTVWADNANCDGTNPNGTLHAFDLYTHPLILPTPTPCPTHYTIAQIGGSCVPGTTDSGNHSDNGTTFISLPFTYTLYDTTYTGVNVSSNGNAQFVTTDNNWVNVCLPWLTHDYTIFPYWDDQRTDANPGCSAYPGGTCGIYTSVTGVAPNRIFNIEWRAVYFNNTSQHANYELRLYEGQTRFDVIYCAVDQGNISATAGVQKDDTIFDQYFCNGSGGAATGGQSYTAQPCAPVPSSAVSRKVHGAAGTFDVPLPLTGNVGVECRSGGATNDYQMIINFASSVTVESASVTSGTGSVSSFSGSGTSQITVNLTGVTNVQRITVTLHNVNDGTHMGNVPVSMGVLVGDVNGNAVVNASDVSLTKAQVGQAVSNSNFREDVNANGTISATDVALVKSKVGTALPPQ